jgi:hypothetical protein
LLCSDEMWRFRIREYSQMEKKKWGLFDFHQERKFNWFINNQYLVIVVGKTFLLNLRAMMLTIDLNGYFSFLLGSNYEKILLRNKNEKKERLLFLFIIISKQQINWTWSKGYFSKSNRSRINFNIHMKWTRKRKFFFLSREMRPLLEEKWASMRLVCSFLYYSTVVHVIYLRFSFHLPLLLLLFLIDHKFIFLSVFDLLLYRENNDPASY